MATPAPDPLPQVSMVMTEELDDAFSRAANDEQVRAIVVFGEGDNFSSGHDLGTSEQTADAQSRGLDGEKSSGKWFDDRWEFDVATCMRWREIPKPTIAMVHGFCICEPAHLYTPHPHLDPPHRHHREIALDCVLAVRQIMGGPWRRAAT